MPVIINGSGSITAHSSPDLILDRVDTASEGGQLSFRRSSDNANVYAIDTFGSTTTPDFRLYNMQTSAVLLNVTSTGVSTFSSNTVNIGTSSIAANGYSRLPNGLLIQWGTSASVAQDSSVAVTFPIAFTTLYSITITNRQAINTGSSGIDSISVSSTTGFTIAHGADGTSTFYWMALGV
jgi:hypothetical protein